jgi:hypothetical protein
MWVVEPVQRPKLHLLPPLKLYREDLEKVVDIFRKQCKSVLIDDEEYRYASVSEIKDKKGKLRVFHVSGMVPHGELWIKSGDDPSVQKSAIWVVETNDHGNLLFLTLKEFLLARRWNLKIQLVRMLFVVGVTVLLVGLLFKPWLTTHLPYGDFSYGLLGVCGVLLFIAAAYVDAKKLSFISLQSSSSKEPFFKRNMDNIVMLVVGTALGSLSTLLIEWVKFRFFK